MIKKNFGHLTSKAGTKYEMTTSDQGKIQVKHKTVWNNIKVKKQLVYLNFTRTRKCTAELVFSGCLIGIQGTYSEIKHKVATVVSTD